MQQHYELSDTEYKIMQLFWKNSDPLPFNEILKYCNDELQLNWAVGTAQTYLNRLILKGVLKTNNKRYLLVDLLRILSLPLLRRQNYLRLM